MSTSTAKTQHREVAPEPASSFAQLDAIVQREAAHGVVRVASDPALYAPIMRHLARRAAQHGRPCWTVGGAATIDAWRQAARRLGADLRADAQPNIIAAAMASAANGGVLIVAEHHRTAWGGAVRDALTTLADDAANELLVLILFAPDAVPASSRGLSVSESKALRLDLTRLAPEDLRRWWSAVVYQDSFVREHDGLEALDSWWQATRTRPMTVGAEPHIGDDAATLRDVLVVARQTLSAAQVAALAPASAVDELVHAHVAERDDLGTLGVTDARPANASPEQIAALVQVLSEIDADGWSCMRAAELATDLGEVERSETLALRAVSMVGDTVARDDLWRRWETIMAALGDATPAGDSPRAGLARLMRTAEHALELGDGDRADRLAREAMRIEGDRFDVLLLHGRTSHARGDVTTAALSLTRAMSIASGAGERARAAGLMAQVRFMAGDPKQADKYARQAIDDGIDVDTRLEGRNVIGKLLLAKESWREAEEHFATDAYEAAVAGRREAELRARLNRGIAVLYLGRREQAREMLEEVLREGESQDVLRAVAFTLSNLATIAILEHRYERAIELSERAIVVRRRIGGRIGLVQPITNLAELRLRLGLVDEAEQSLRFGLLACGQGLPLSRYAYFAKLSACIHLERGETAQAAKELATAMSGASCSGDKGQLAQCHRIAARIALEDGDIARARAAIASADELRHTAFGQAELEVIRGAVLRAAGEPFDGVARNALVLAQQADDPESLREAHVLLCGAYQLDGDHEAAQSHLRSARAVVARIAESLPQALSQRYLRRPCVMALDHVIEHDDAPMADDGAPVTARSGAAVLSARAAAPQPNRRLIGDSSTMRALRGTIRRVARMNATVLITGETGTGKELVAEALHRASNRAHGPLVKVNCAALVETLLLSELFGHEKGAFTGASTRRRGRFEIAEGGTLFLDEIGDISARTQVALLRVLQESTFERVGGCTQLHANVRIVCATHRDLRAMVARGEFREDLYYRLCGVVLEVPALKDRVADLPALSAALLERAQRTTGIERRPLAPSAIAGLSRHPWPGNVRELENALRVAALFAKGDHIELSDFTDNVEGLRELSADVTSGGPTEWGTIPPPSGDGCRDSLPAPTSSTDLVYAEIRGGFKLAEMKKKLEHECIARALVESGGNITRAAKILGMKRPRLSQLVKQYNLASVLEDIKA